MDFWRITVCPYFFLPNEHCYEWWILNIEAFCPLFWKMKIWGILGIKTHCACFVCLLLIWYTKNLRNATSNGFIRKDAIFFAQLWLALIFNGLKSIFFALNQPWKMKLDEIGHALREGQQHYCEAQKSATFTTTFSTSLKIAKKQFLLIFPDFKSEAKILWFDFPIFYPFGNASNIRVKLCSLLKTNSNHNCLSQQCNTTH